MHFSASTAGLTLIESGIIHVIVEQDPSVTFNIEGLKLIFTLNLLPIGSSELIGSTLVVEDGVVHLRQSIKETSPGNVAPTGMLLPVSVAVRSNGEEILMMWMVDSRFIQNGQLVATLTYSFYERKNG